MNRWKVLLCSEIPLYTQSLAMAFEESHSFSVAEKLEPRKLLERTTLLQPDIVVWKVTGTEFISSIKELIVCCPMVQIVIIIESTGDLDLMAILESGVRGCLPMRLLPRQIVKAVELIVTTGILCMPRIRHESADQLCLEKTFNLPNLTRREKDVIFFLAKGNSNQEIARALCLSESTVKSHLRSTFKKFNVHNRTEVLALLYHQEKERRK